MSLFLSEWINGYNQFLFYGDIGWAPQIQLKEKDGDSDRVLVYTSCLDHDLMVSVAKNLGDVLGHQFLDRFLVAEKFVLRLIDFESFLNSNLSSVIDATSDLKEAAEVLTEAFNCYILDYEFWRKRDIVQLHANLIFYSMLEYPNPVTFFIPPKNKWKEYSSGWAGYLPEE